MIGGKFDVAIKGDDFQWRSIARAFYLIWLFFCSTRIAAAAAAVAFAATTAATTAATVGFAATTTY